MPVGFRTRWPPEWTQRLLELVDEEPAWRYAIFTRSVIQQKEIWKVYRDINIALYEDDAAWQRGMKADGLVVFDKQRGCWIATDKWDSHVNNPVANKIYMLKAMMDKDEAVKEFGIDPNWTSFEQLPKSKRAPFQKLYPYYFLLKRLYTEPPPYAPPSLPRTRSANVPSTSSASTSRQRTRRPRLESKPVHVKREDEPESDDDIVEIEPVKRVYPPPIVVSDSSDEEQEVRRRSGLRTARRSSGSSSNSPSPLRSPHWKPALLADVSEEQDSNEEDDPTATHMRLRSSSPVDGGRKMGQSLPSGPGRVQAKPDLVSERRKRYKQKKVAQGQVIPTVATNRARRGRSRV